MARLSRALPALKPHISRSADGTPTINFADPLAVRALNSALLLEQYGIALVNGSPWVEKVNAALAEMKADGTYKTIYEKWFGEMPETK